MMLMSCSHLFYNRPQGAAPFMQAIAHIEPLLWHSCVLVLAFLKSAHWRQRSRVCSPSPVCCRCANGGSIGKPFEVSLTLIDSRCVMSCPGSSTTCSVQAASSVQSFDDVSQARRT